jgi:glycosyltransferase involved in cell wall biosynthesis
MKLLYVIGSTELGGAEQHLLGVATALCARGYKPEIFAMVPDGALTSTFEENGVPVRGPRLAPWIQKIIKQPRVLAWVKLFYFATSLWLYLWKVRPKVIHFFLPASYIVGGVVSLFGPPIKRIMSRRSLNYYQQNHVLYARIEHCLHRKMDIVCGNSQAVIRDLRNEGVNLDRLKLIYNGLNLSKFENIKDREITRAELGIAPDQIVFIMVANLIPYKGHKDIINAFSLIKGEMTTPWVCLFVGRDDGIQGDLEAEVGRYGLNLNILFLGSRTNVPELLCASDIGVLCSHEEGFSNAVLEGMAASLPMVVTNVGGNAEAVIDGVNGYVVEPRNPPALSSALLNMYLSPCREIIGAAGKNRVQSVFSQENCIAEYCGLYK